MSGNKCRGCDTPIPYGKEFCPMCGAPFTPQYLTTTPITPQQNNTPQVITEIHHHHTAQPDKPVLIEATSKEWKKIQLWSALFALFGLVTCSSSSGHSSPEIQLSAACWLIAFVTYLYAKIGAWWHHG